MPGVSLITKGKICPADPGQDIGNKKCIGVKINIKDSRRFKINIKKCKD